MDTSVAGHACWLARAEALTPPARLVIDGRTVPARDGAMSPVISPRDGATLAEVPKESGNGRDKSVHALDKYSELKTTWIAL